MVDISTVSIFKTNNFFIGKEIIINKPIVLKPTKIHNFTYDGYITGMINKRINYHSLDTIPVTSNVFIYDGKTNELVDTTYSDANGEYTFTNLKRNHLYIIVSIDGGDSIINQYFLE